MSKIRGQVGMSVGVLLHFFICHVWGVNRLFAMIRELPSPLMFAFIGEQAGFGASHLSDSSRVSVAKQPNHLPFALGRICFRPWSKAFSTLVKSLFD